MYFVQNHTTIYFDIVVFQLCNDSSLQFTAYVLHHVYEISLMVVFISHVVLFLEELSFQNILT